jgi:hypothetical protein
MKSKTVQLHLVVTISFLVLIFNSCASSRPNTRSGSTHDPLDSVQRQADGVTAAKRPSLFSKSVSGPPARSDNGAGETGVATLEESTDKEAGVEESDNPGTPDLSTPEKSVQKILDEALNYCEVSQVFWQKGELDNALEALDQASSSRRKICDSLYPSASLRFMHPATSSSTEITTRFRW